METSPRYVIIDQDTGTDDAWALAMLLKAEKTHNIKVVAVTAVAGNTTVEHVVRNTARVLEVYQRTDIPLFKGAESAFIPAGAPEHEPFHGVDGFGDIAFESEPALSMLQSERAAIAMHRLVSERPKQITLICCGPLTNVALAIKLFPEFADNVKDIYIMGGNCQGSGNTIRRATEFNFYVDSEAAHIVINNLKCPITVLPWEAYFKDLQLESSWRFDVLANVDHPFVHFMNPIERKIFLPKKLRNWPIVDALLVACVLFPDRLIRRQAERNCDVELNGTQTRGMLVIDYLGTFGRPNVTVIESLNSDAAKEVLTWTVQQ